MDNLIQEVREALKKATTGEWSVKDENYPAVISTFGPLLSVVASNMRQYDAELLANTPTYLSALCDRVEAIQEVNNTLVDVICGVHYELLRLKPLLNLPERGYVRNSFNRLTDTMVLDKILPQASESTAILSKAEADKNLIKRLEGIT